PWTRLFIQSHKDKEVADRDTVGHRGTPIGRVSKVTQGREARLRFVTNRPLQRHDGLQIDLPVLGKPFGFAVDHMWLISRANSQKPREVFEAPTGPLVEVGLPAEHPTIPIDAPVYCSSSQEVKQRYRHDRPKQGAYRARQALRIDAVLTQDRLIVNA